MWLVMAVLCWQILEPTAAVNVPGEAIVIESTTVKGLGNVADCVVRWGMLKQGDYFVVGNTVSLSAVGLDSVCAGLLCI